jgi:hypothetical protein
MHLAYPMVSGCIVVDVVASKRNDRAAFITHRSIRSGDPLIRRWRRSSVRNRRTSPSRSPRRKEKFLALLKKNIGVSRRQPHKVSTLQVASKKKRQVKSIPREIQGRCKKQSKQASMQIGNHLRNLGRFDLVSFFHHRCRHHRIWSSSIGVLVSSFFFLVRNAHRL